MDRAVRRRIAGLALGAACASGLIGWAALEHTTGSTGSGTERIVSVRPTEVQPTSPTVAQLTPTTAPPTTTPPAAAPPTTTPPAPAPIAAAPIAAATPAPATVAQVAPAGSGGALGQSVQQQMLALVNAKRASGTTCGNTAYASAPALSLHAALVQAADTYAMDMATYDYFSHTGRDGSDTGQRLTRAGYRWSAWGENIASGQTASDAVVAGWFGSASHCSTFMNPALTEIGFGNAEDPASTYRTYWVAALGRPS